MFKTKFFSEILNFDIRYCFGFRYSYSNLNSSARSWTSSSTFWPRRRKARDSMGILIQFGGNRPGKIQRFADINPHGFFNLIFP